MRLYSGVIPYCILYVELARPEVIAVHARLWLLALDSFARLHSCLIGAGGSVRG